MKSKPANQDVRSAAEMTDAEVLTLADSLMDIDPANRQAELPHKQQVETLTEAESLELNNLLHMYQASQLRKSQAMAEAVRRGLVSP